MEKPGFGRFILAFAVLAGGQQALAQQPASQPQQPPASLQQGTQDQLPPPPPQAVVSKTNLVEKVNAPSYVDVNCAGFITNQQDPEGTYVTSAWDTRYETLVSEGRYVYLTRTGFQEDHQDYIIRKLNNP